MHSRPGFRLATVAERKAHKIPPMYVDALVNEDPTAALQAVAWSPKTGKPCYFYSAKHRESAAKRKWKRVQHLMGHMPKIAARVEAASAKGIPEAMVLRLILQTGMRNGNPCQAVVGKYESFGASSLQLRHTEYLGSNILKLSFAGKKGVMQEYVVEDDVLVAYICSKIGGPETDRIFPTTAHKVLRYLRKIDKKVKVHDLRTWLGCSLAQAYIDAFRAEDPEIPPKKLAKAVAKAVAQKLGNTPGVAMKSYIDPALWEE